MKKKRLLVSGFSPGKEFDVLNRYTEVYWLDQLDEKGLDTILPTIGCLLVNFWPKELGRERLERMSALEFIQSGLAGVNQVPFGQLRDDVVVSSNAGGYSDEVGEFAWGILLAAAKRIVKYDHAIKSDGFVRPSAAQLGNEVMFLKGANLGIIGYGGIGRSVAKFGKAFGMKIQVFSRREIHEEGVAPFRGSSGLKRMLQQCDMIVITLPLTKSTYRMLGKDEFGLMKRRAVLVNVARAEIVDEKALYGHLVRNGDFIYGTDVWWLKAGHESFSPELPFLKLDNFIGTPHASGPSALLGGGPLRHALGNLVRFFKGEVPRNIVRREEYVQGFGS